MGKKLYRSRKNKSLAGVCGGIAEFFGIDPTIVRIVWLITIFLGGTGVVAYIIAAIIIPEKKFDNYDTNYDTKKESRDEEEYANKYDPNEWRETSNFDADKNKKILGIGLVIFGGILFFKEFVHLDMKIILPVAFILGGMAIIYKGRRD